MVKKTTLLLSMLLCMMSCFVLSSCGDDNEPSNDSPILGTWVYDAGSSTYEDYYTLVFNSDYSGSIENSYGSRATEKMNFEWSLTTTSDGTYRLSVIYISGDKYIDGPFDGGYAQWNRTVTIAGNTLSIQLNSSTVMLFRRK